MFVVSQWAVVSVMLLINIVIIKTMSHITTCNSLVKLEKTGTQAGTILGLATAVM